MTVLETEKSVTSVPSMSDRYITPEYLAHLPTSPESKNEKSPLQLLAQTCSQIGVDNGPSKILSGSDKLKASDEKSKKVLDSLSAVAGGSGEADKVSFKPYRSSEGSERSASARLAASVSPVSSSSPVSVSASSEVKTKDQRPGDQPHQPHKSVTSGHKALSSPSPIIQSGMELLTSAPKLSTLPPSSAYDPTNPAFRPPGLESGAGFLSAAGGSAGAAHAAALKDSLDPMASYNAYLARLGMTGAPSPSGLPPGYMELLESYRMYSAAAAAAGAGMRLPGPGLGSPESQLAAYSQLLAGAGAGGLTRPGYPGPSALSASLASSRYSPYPKPGYPGPAPLPPSIPGLPGQLPPHLQSLGAMGATNQQMALYSLLGGRL